MDKETYREGVLLPMGREAWELESDETEAREDTAEVWSPPVKASILFSLGTVRTGSDLRV